jgi:GMP synthase-like glutamine amidotransferase
VLSIQNITCETLGSLEKLFKSDGFEIQNINAQNDSIPEKSEGYSAIIVLGGPMAVYDRLPHLQREQALIRDAVENNVPVLGICLGSQLIAQATGGRVFKGSKKEIGWHDVSVSPAGKNGLFTGIEKMRVFQWHGDTYELPATAEVLAYSDLYPQAFRVGSAIGIQFHLEVDDRLIRSWLKEYDGEVKSEGIDSQKILPKAGDIEQLSEMCSRVYRNFAKMIR